jgi:hypothetical protein
MKKQKLTNTASSTAITLVAIQLSFGLREFLFNAVSLQQGAVNFMWGA